MISRTRWGLKIRPEPPPYIHDAELLLIGIWFLRLTPVKENCFCVGFIGAEFTPLWAGSKLL